MQTVTRDKLHPLDDLIAAKDADLEEWAQQIELDRNLEANPESSALPPSP